MVYITPQFLRTTIKVDKIPRDFVNVQEVQKTLFPFFVKNEGPIFIKEVSSRKSILIYIM
ncbi:hypothetical protein Bccel_4854 [Pseudobacteroides cellulosolvens ATCC 35603 = DSM 2933]|uniref:Uncharacterized protein n=1 Tax=Pseudobacteroides cellulosolvens ATCC 35603 = DSM 2933 TaxID=398512 RepID=A0A0L6JVA2_9FIRM|nr:hypothetical protein Bccel_4854 [Pseudobacteroides cellulosolvens ATCC 35603 = DSM 2933]